MSYLDLKTTFKIFKYVINVQFLSVYFIFHIYILLDFFNSTINS